MIAANKLQTLIDVYRSTNNERVLRPMDLVDCADQGRPYIYDTQPLMDQLDAYLDHPAYDTIMHSALKLCFNSVCLQTGMVTVFSTKEINVSSAYDNILIENIDMMKKGMKGSSNQAAFMNPIEINGKQYVDRGNSEVIPTRVVVSNISPNGEHEVYPLINNPDQLGPRNKIYTSIIEVLFRAVTMFIQEVRENDLETLVGFKNLANRPVKIYYIHPEKELDTEFPTGLRFDNLRMREWMEQGKQRAEAILSGFPEGNLGSIA